jgi:tetratricopeptide (TPR) repeat protein
MRRVLVVAALMALAPTVHAADATTTREAKEHFDRAMAHYELGEFPAAVEEFKQAYALSQAPGLLFNLAQASRLAKDYEQALHFYRTYLRVRPDAPNRADVEQRIAELEPIVEARRKADLERLSAENAPDKGKAAETARLGETTAVRVLPPSGKKEKIAGLVVGALGLAALGAGIGVGVAALDAQNQLSKLAMDMGTWTPAQQDKYATGEREAAAATALYVVGGAAVVTGVVLYIVGWRKDRARFAVAPTAGGGAQAVWSCAF